MGANQSSQPGAPVPALPAAASLLEKTFQPAFDYDTDSCYPAPAIGADGKLNPGLPLRGKVSEGCHLAEMLSNTNSYSRSRCNGDWCGIVYDLYFQKDQSTEAVVGALGHVHDIEHVVVWVKIDKTGSGATANLEYVSTSAHGEYQVHEKKNLFFDDEAKRHAKIVYHKDGGLTHAFRKAQAVNKNGPCEPPENHLNLWQYPPVVGWEGWPTGLRDVLTGHDFGKANLAIKDSRFVANLKRAMPDHINFNPSGPNEFVWDGESPETGELRRAVVEEPAPERDEL